MEEHISIGGELAKTNNLIARKLSTILSDQVMNISPVQISIMRYLVKEKNKPILQKDIEEIFNIRRSTVSGILKTMEKNNLIIRRNIKDDSKSKEIMLTYTTYENLQKIEYDLTNLDLLLMQNIKKEDMDTFLRVLEQIRKNLKEEGKL